MEECPWQKEQCPKLDKDLADIKVDGILRFVRRKGVEEALDNAEPAQIGRPVLFSMLKRSRGYVAFRIASVPTWPVLSHLRKRDINRRGIQNAAALASCNVG
jgi:hypothetical protein